ncbi:DEAD-domain-containing protein [Microthyrium microscopicum]|uniref:DEAD-domain-containing protein n=1 Tax=Microthyrium microscopicum TaxID=703497 RepID=A0A6A6U1F7_9PEZI|nr:DEAD-domain-containing protein [Microthyrium microscopicum]
MAQLSKKRKLNESLKPTPANDEPPSKKRTPIDTDNATESHTTTADTNTLKTFRDLGIIPELCDACEKLGFTSPRPIQVQAIPHALAGRDVIGLAETGSGKTAAFALPMLQALMENPSPLFGLVLAPTRELASQIRKHIEGIGSIINVRCTEITGGSPTIDQAKALQKSPHIIVATPGRLLDHLENTKGFHLRNLKFLVFDEADRLLDLNFSDAINKILKELPHERRTFLFSATMSKHIGSLQRASLRDPVRVSASANTTVSGLHQEWVLIPVVQKDLLLAFLLKDKYPGAKTIIFCRTINKTQELAYLLRVLNFSAIPIHGDLPQSARNLSLSKFTTGGRNILIATDVASRGLDIPAVDLVVNYDLPDDDKTYIHRVGRTARAGRTGRAVSMVTQYDAELWLRIEAALAKTSDTAQTQKPPMDVPQDEMMVLAGSVGEAQIAAKKQLRQAQEKGKKRGGIGKGSGGPPGGFGKKGRGDRRGRTNDREEA